MKKNFKCILLQLSVVVAISFSLQSCGGDGNGIATLEDGVITVDFSAARKLEEKILNLSDFISDYSCVQLDGDIEAYVDGVLSVSDNYIVACRFAAPFSPVKLFDRKSGKFLRDIGRIGNGPGEYAGWYTCVEIDEKRDRVYVASRVRGLMIFDINGTFIKTVDLKEDVLIARVVVDNKSGNLLISGLTDMGYSIYKITPGGEVLSCIDEPSVESENPNIFKVKILITCAESIYSTIYGHWSNGEIVLDLFDAEQMSSTPVFKVSNLSAKVMSELEDISLGLSLGSVGERILIMEDIRDITRDGDAILKKKGVDENRYLVNIKTLEVEKVDLFDDYTLVSGLNNRLFGLGELYFNSYDAIEFVSKLKETLSNLPEDADAKSIENVKNLLKSIDEEGNTVVISGRYKN